MQETSTLPVAQILEPLHEALEQAPVVLQAPPGAGKSTLLPLSLLQRDTTSRWILVQPRRLAALSIANFIATQLGEEVGQQVGYQIRQQSRRSQRTRLLVVTEGILTRMLQSDPALTDFNGVIFDEFHERNLHSDLGLALVLESMQLRNDLKLLVMSATLPAEALAVWLKSHGAKAQILQSEGRQFPIEIDYRPPAPSRNSKRGAQSYLQTTVQAIGDVIEQYPNYRGILVFLPGQREIQQVMAETTSKLGVHTDVDIIPLHGALSLSQQQQATAPIAAQGRRRVILATNIAETSLTIDGIDWVIDSGRERQAIYRSNYKISELVTRRIAKAAAAQRAGRAGRTGPGRCTRIYSTNDWHGMADYRPADIEQQDLTSLVLQVASWGSSTEQLAWFSPPNPGHLISAQTWLQSIGALSDTAQINAYGRKVAAFPSEPQYAHALLQAQSETELAQAVCVLIGIDEAREQRQIDLLHAVEAVVNDRPGWHKSRQRMQAWLAQQRLTAPSHLLEETIITAALLVWPLGLAKQRPSGAGYQLASGMGGEWAANYVGPMVSSNWLIVSGLSLHENQRNGRIQQAASIPTEVLNRLTHGRLAMQLRHYDEIRWGSEKGGLRKFEVTAYHQLILSEKESRSPITAEQRIEAYVSYVQQHGLATLDWHEASIQLVRRVTILDKFYDRETRFRDARLLATLADWAAPFWHDITSLRELSVWQPYTALRQQLNYAEQQELEILLPRNWTAPSGRQHRICYQVDGSALVSLKLQEVFGAAQTPTLLHGELPLTLELLSPAGRPLQRTSDLAGFWQGAYSAVKKEMRGRYPKHPWPDDPTRATATHLTKRALNG